MTAHRTQPEAQKMRTPLKCSVVWKDFWLFKVAQMHRRMFAKPTAECLPAQCKTLQYQTLSLVPCPVTKNKETLMQQFTLL